MEKSFSSLYFIICLNIKQPILYFTKTSQVNKTFVLANLSAARMLGVSFDLDDLKTDLDDRENIFFMLDPAHMLKLIRNTWKERYFE